MHSATMFPPRTILVPLDLSEDSLAGLEAARLLAERWRSRVELIHVDEGPAPAFAEEMDHWSAESLEAANRDLHHRLEWAAQPIPRSAAHVLTGAPAAIVPRLAADAAADLVVLALHRRRKLPPFLSRSLAEVSASAASVPVLTVRSRPAPGWPRRILAPVHWAPYGDRALVAARDWATALGAELGFLHVFEGGVDDEMERHAVVENVAGIFGGAAPRAAWHWALGRPLDEIGRVVSAGGYDLVVVAEHGRETWKEALFGTMAQRVLRRSAVPVLAVPASSPTGAATKARRRARGWGIFSRGVDTFRRP